jgi:hypothetical protein
MRTERVQNHLFLAIEHDLRAIEQKLTKLENQKTPTFPRPGTADELGPVGVFGQLVIGDDDVVYSFNDSGWTDSTI